MGSLPLHHCVQITALSLFFRCCDDNVQWLEVSTWHCVLLYATWLATYVNGFLHGCNRLEDLTSGEAWLLCVAYIIWKCCLWVQCHEQLNSSPAVFVNCVLTVFLINHYHVLLTLNCYIAEALRYFLTGSLLRHYANDV